MEMSENCHQSKKSDNKIKQGKRHTDCNVTSNKLHRNGSIAIHIKWGRIGSGGSTGLQNRIVHTSG